jgi:transposase
MKRVPVWALDDDKLKEIVTRCFPHQSQKKQALRMLRIIYLYYRAGTTAGVIASELHMSIRAVEESIRRINKTANRPPKPRGRPKKNVQTIHTESF